MLLADLCTYLDAFAPTRLAENWDNVGLLMGDRAAEVQRVMTCLTLTPASVAEAVRERAELVISHHPLPFKPVQRLTTDNTPGRLLWELAGGKVAVYSPHTAFDSAREGINQRLATGIGLTDIRPLIPAPADPEGLGSGRVGRPAKPLLCAEFGGQVAKFLGIKHWQLVGDGWRVVRNVAVGCGSGGSFLSAAARAGCDTLVTGEATFHTSLEAEALGINLLLAGHYATERFAVERLAEQLARDFPALTVWPSRDERDPIRCFS